MVEWYEPYAALGALLSAIVTTIVAVFLYQQTHHMKEQTSEIKNEISNRMRPWIKIETLQPSFAGLPKGEQIPWEIFADKYKLTDLEYVAFTCKIKNIGSLPSKEVFLKSVRTNYKISKTDLWNLRLENLIPFPLMPDESKLVNLIIQKNDFLRFFKSPDYFGVHIGYRIADSKTSTIGKIWKLWGKAVEDDDYWIDEP